MGQAGRLRRRLRAFGLALVAAMAVTACAATYQNHGYIPNEALLERIEPGVDTRDTVDLLIGQPSTSGVIRDEAWFYAGYRIRNFAYRAPEVVSRDVVAISFDENGRVANVERFGLEDGQMVQLSRRVTGTGVGEVTILTQILRNFGRIDITNILSSDN
ncbi:outer membrane protein assembly factor BamE [Rhodobacterales bacterium HKCCE2091]|nr:outer membrane protein assembly factor BamE [Rhodobacterales bacterium HKCCE2091]